MKNIYGETLVESIAKRSTFNKGDTNFYAALVFVILYLILISAGFANDSNSCINSYSIEKEGEECIVADKNEIREHTTPTRHVEIVANAQRSGSMDDPSTGHFETGQVLEAVASYEASQQAMEDAYEMLYRPMIDIGTLDCSVELSNDGSTDRAQIASLDFIPSFSDCLALTLRAIYTDRPVKFALLLEYRAVLGESDADFSIHSLHPKQAIDRRFLLQRGTIAEGASSHSGVFAVEGMCAYTTNPECILQPIDILHKSLEKLEIRILRAFVDNDEVPTRGAQRAPSNFINGGFDTADGGWTYRARGAQPAYSCRPISDAESVWKAGLHDTLSGFPAPSSILLSEQAAIAARQRIDHHQMSQIVDVPSNATEFSFSWRPNKNENGGDIDLMVIAQDLTTGQEVRILWWQGGDLPWGHVDIPFTNPLISNLVGHTVNFIFIVCDSGSQKGFGRFDEIGIASEGELNPDLFEEDDQDSQASAYSGTVEMRNFSDDVTDWVRFTTNTTLVNTYSIVNPGADVFACLNLFSRLVDGSAGALLQRRCASTAGESVSMSLVQSAGAYLVMIENMFGASVEHSEYQFAINSSPVTQTDIFEDDDHHTQWKAYMGSPQHRNFADDTVDWVATYNNDFGFRTYQTFTLGANVDTCITVYTVTADGAPGTVAGHDCDGGAGDGSRLMLLQQTGAYLVKIVNENQFAGESTDYIFRILNDPL